MTRRDPTEPTLCVHGLGDAGLPTAKLIQNAHRDASIALANETAKLAHEHHVNAREAIELANSRRRVDILSPGHGVGGHCLPIGPLFLNLDSDHADRTEAARRIDDGMVPDVTELLTDAVGPLKGKRIAVLGVAYKRGVGDTRHSHAPSLVEHRDDVGPEVTTRSTRRERAPTARRPRRSSDQRRWRRHGSSRVHEPPPGASRRTDGRPHAGRYPGDARSQPLADARLRRERGVIR